MKYRTIDSLLRDEGGFTTTGMVLSLLITLALVFTSAQVYRVNSASAEVQDVADAAALAAENQVAEFMIVARFCDAVVLSLSLTGLASCGLGVAALCTPSTAAFSEGLIDAGRQIIEARNDFADRSQEVLDKMQKALPFFAAACAANVASSNNGDSAGASYLGIALLVPDEGVPIEADTGDDADKLIDDVENEADGIREKAREAEEAAQAANEAKRLAYLHDCGNNPNYCMYERADHLAGMSGASNPFYSSVDTWSFSVALERAKRYYGNRGENEEPTGNAPGDLARWRLRLAFYEYAFDLLDREGYVRESGDSFDANFPRLPKNTAEMRDTSLYNDKAFPITEEPGEGGELMPVMHAWPGCPGATGPVTVRESIAYMESANLPTCPVCEFTAASMGKVAAASTSIENGFEYHYDIVASEAQRYQEERARADAPKREVEEHAGNLFAELADALKQAVGRRVEVSPPGASGAVALVVNGGTTSTGFSSGFVAYSGSLGPRAAVSASTLVDEGSEEGRTVLNSMLDGLRQDGGAAVGAAGVVLDVWSRVLLAYSNGVEALVGGVESGLGQLPLVGESGLGKWAADALHKSLDDIGLQPAKLEALKPVLVNSAHVASRDDGRLATSLVAIKQRVLAHPLYSTDLFSSLLGDAEREAVSRVGDLDGSIEIASVELFGEGGPSIPITIPLPEEARRFGIDMLQGFFDRLRAVHAETVEVRSWE